MAHKWDQGKQYRPKSDDAAASDQDLHCLLTGISIKKKVKQCAPHPLNDQWNRPIYSEWRVH